MSLNFECTQCGRCCRDLKLPLTVPEAVAWLEDGHAVGRQEIQQSRDSDALNIDIKRRLCAALHIDCAALVGEGFVVYSPERQMLLAALVRVIDGEDSTHDAGWRFVSNQPGSIEGLTQRGALGAVEGAGVTPSFEYIGFLAPPARTGAVQAATP